MVFDATAELRAADQRGELQALFAPQLTRKERRIAEIEGWIPGVR